MNARTCLIPLSCAVALGLFAVPQSAQAQTVLFSDDFNVDTSANWSLHFHFVGDNIPDYTADFMFDYGDTDYTSDGVTAKIPPSPNAANAMTRALKLTVNNNDEIEAAGAVSLYPNGQHFSGDFALKLDMWINYNGAAWGGTGSTEHGTFGINHAGDKPLWQGAPLGDGVWFAVSGEGGDNPDYRAYVGDGLNPPDIVTDGFLDRDEDGVVENDAASGHSDDHPLRLMFPNPPFETPGAVGKQWVQVEVRQREDIVTWLINGYVINEHSHGEFLGQTAGNIMIGYMDRFNSIANPREDNFILFDNVRVIDLTDAPEPNVVRIEATDPFAVEPGIDPTSTATFTVTRSGDTSEPLTVGYHILGTADNGTDYEELPGFVIIPAGSASAEIVVKPLPDDLLEEQETVILFLIPNPDEFEVRGTFEHPVMATAYIDDDGAGRPAVTVTTPRAVASENDPLNAGVFRFELSSMPAEDVVVNFTVGGTAVSGEDYEAIPSSITFPAWEEAAIEIKIAGIDNDVVDGDRTVIVTLEPGETYSVGEPDNGTVTIYDDDLEPGVVVFEDDFNTDTSANWIVNMHNDDNRVTFNYDYSLDGIPPAPRSEGGATRGVKLESNLANNVATGVSISPSGLNVSGDFRLTFDMWLNYHGGPGSAGNIGQGGTFLAGGTGSTEALTAGIGTSGAIPQWTGGEHDSLWIVMFGDGGAAQDYRVYLPGTSGVDAQLPASSGVFAAGTGTSPDARNDVHPYYFGFGERTAPEFQINEDPAQDGLTRLGAAGFAWRKVTITKEGDTVSWTMDGIPIATVDVSGIEFGGDNIFIGYADPFASLASNARWLFGLVDNLRVEALAEVGPPQAPEITGIEIVDDLVRIDFTGAETDSATDFTLQSAAEVEGPYVDVEASITLLAPGSFRATVAVSGEMQFYQIKR